MVRIRRKGVAIVDTHKGILVVSGRKKIFTLPGGGAEKGESRKRATIRELEEETKLKSKSIRYLFSYKGRKWKSHNGQIVKNHAKVFLVKVSGKPKPSHEIKYINYWKLGSKIRISHRTEDLIKKYFEALKNH